MSSGSSRHLRPDIVVTTPGGTADYTGCSYTSSLLPERIMNSVLIVRDIAGQTPYVDVIPQVTDPVITLRGTRTWETYAQSCRQAQWLRRTMRTFAPPEGLLSWASRSPDERITDVRAHLSQGCEFAALSGWTIVFPTHEQCKLYSHMICGNCSTRKHEFDKDERAALRTIPKGVIYVQLNHAQRTGHVGFVWLSMPSAGSTELNYLQQAALDRFKSVIISQVAQDVGVSGRRWTVQERYQRCTEYARYYQPYDDFVNRHTLTVASLDNEDEGGDVSPDPWMSATMGDPWAGERRRSFFQLMESADQSG